MIGRMDKTHLQRVLCGDAIEYGLYEVSAHGTVLHAGSDGDRAETYDRGAFVEEVTPDDLPIQLRHHRIQPRMCQPLRHAGHGNLRRRVVRGKVVLRGNGREGVVANGPTNRGVFRRAWAEYEWHRVSSLVAGLSAHTAIQKPQLMYDSISYKNLTPGLSRAWQP